MRAEIKTKQALHTLVRLYSDLAGQGRSADMRHVAAVIKLIKPSYDVASIAAKRRNGANPWFRRGQGFRLALNVLRRASGPLTAREIAVQMLREVGIKPTPKDIWGAAMMVRASLRNHNGKSVETVGEGMPVRWRLKA